MHDRDQFTRSYSRDTAVVTVLWTDKEAGHDRSTEGTELRAAIFGIDYSGRPAPPNVVEQDRTCQ
jgi:hypothetical protein